MPVGAGHTHFEDRQFADAAASAGATSWSCSCRSAIVLARWRCFRQPSVASKRHDWRVGDIDYLDVWVRSDQNRRLADHVIYLCGRTPIAVATHVAGLLERPPGAEHP